MESIECGTGWISVAEVVGEPEGLRCANCRMGGDGCGGGMDWAHRPTSVAGRFLGARACAVSPVCLSCDALCEHPALLQLLRPTTWKPTLERGNQLEEMLLASVHARARA